MAHTQKRVTEINFQFILMIYIRKDSYFNTFLLIYYINK